MIKYSIHSSLDELISGCKDQDKLAQRYLYEKYFKMLMQKALRYSKNDREIGLEIVNNAFLSVFTHLHDFRGENFEGWISKIVTNKALHKIRSDNNYYKHIDAEIPNDFVLQESDPISHLSASEINNQINRVSEPQRSIFILNNIDGYKIREIAQMLEMNENTIKWHLVEAKKSLAKSVNNYKYK